MKAKTLAIGAVFGAIAGHILEEPIKALISTLRGGGKDATASDTKSGSEGNDRPQGSQ
jgi:hypothetical protein